MKTQVAKWGNSMAVRIPKNVAEAAKLRPGDNLELSVEGSGTVRIRKKKGTSNLEISFGKSLRQISTRKRMGALQKAKNCGSPRVCA